MPAKSDINNPLLSIVICTYNREKYIVDSLTHLAIQKCNKESYEVLIINNNSTDSTETKCLTFIKDHPQLNISYIFEEKQGHSYARNSA